MLNNLCSGNLKRINSPTHRTLFFALNFMSILLLLSMPVKAEKKTAHDLSSDLFDSHLTTPPGGNFTLKSSNGPVSLSQYKNKVVILLFGYLSCPDLCPTLMRNVANALNRVDIQERHDVQALFITLDPERDELKNLDKFVQYFNENIIALTGSEQQVREVADLYGVKYSKKYTDISRNEYSIHHSIASYVLSPDNVIRFILTHETTSEDLVTVIHNIFKKYYPPGLDH